MGLQICLFPLGSGRWLDIRQKDVEMVLHIDDDIIPGPSEQVTEIWRALQEKVAMKDLGRIDEHSKKYLGKIIKKTAKGSTIRADPEFYDKLLEETS